MQVTIARQLCLDPSTVSNFFMNARRRSVDKWKDENENANANSVMPYDDDDEEFSPEEDALPMQVQQTQQAQVIQSGQVVTQQGQTVTLARFTADGQVKTSPAVLVAASPAAVVQQLHAPSAGGDLTPTSLGGTGLELWHEAASPPTVVATPTATPQTTLLRIVQPVFAAANAVSTNKSTTLRPSTNVAASISLPVTPLPLRDVPSSATPTNALNATPPEQILEEEVVAEDDSAG